MTIYLYVKTHNITGLKYFGKTIKANPEKYNGSGLYWKRHLKIHGNNISTKIIGKYDDYDKCSDDAIKFSIENNIIESKEWANLIIENGKDGAPFGHIGHKFTAKQIKKISKSSFNKWKNTEYREKLIEIHKNRWNDELKNKQSIRLKEEFWTDERKKSHSDKMKGKPGTKKLRGIPKTDEHNRKISESNKGKPKSKQHIENMKKPKSRICRIFDKKEMAVATFTKWIKTLIP